MNSSSASSKPYIPLSHHRQPVCHNSKPSYGYRSFASRQGIPNLLHIYSHHISCLWKAPISHSHGPGAVRRQTRSKETPATSTLFVDYCIICIRFLVSWFVLLMVTVPPPRFHFVNYTSTILTSLNRPLTAYTTGPLHNPYPDRKRSSHHSLNPLLSPHHSFPRFRNGTLIRHFAQRPHCLFSQRKPSSTAFKRPTYACRLPSIVCM